MRDRARHRAERRAYGSVLHTHCDSTHPPLLLLGQDAAGTVDCGEQGGMGDCAAWCTDERAEAWHVSTWDEHRQLSVDGPYFACRCGRLHAESADRQHVSRRCTGRLLVRLITIVVLTLGLACAVAMPHWQASTSPAPR